MMTKNESFSITDTVGSIVARRPALSRVFEQAGIDYCCGGKLTLSDACRKKGVEIQTLIAALENAAAMDGGDPVVDAAAMTLTDLADHIEQSHHAYLKTELPRLAAMTQRVATVHGGEDARLCQVRDTYAALAGEMTSHMMKEEQILFPLVRRIDAGQSESAFHCGSIANPIGQMEREHDQAGAALTRLRELTDGFTPPEWACNTYRAMLEGLARLERDMHQHVHKENNVLFPRAIDMETQKAQ